MSKWLYGFAEALFTKSDPPSKYLEVVSNRNAQEPPAAAQGVARQIVKMARLWQEWEWYKASLHVKALQEDLNAIGASLEALKQREKMLSDAVMAQREPVQP